LLGHLVAARLIERDQVNGYIMALAIPCGSLLPCERSLQIGAAEIIFDHNPHTGRLAWPLGLFKMLNRISDIIVTVC
jgi:hypothetical protein